VCEFMMALPSHLSTKEKKEQAPYFINIYMI